MEITSQKTDDGIIIFVKGRIDTTNYNEFENAVNDIFKDDVSQIYLDCSALNYISSSGLRVFLTIQKKMMGTGGKFKLFAMQPSIKEIFDISGFSSIFSIYADFETAKQN
ncbi:STAS domain-containing protein [Maribellus maritimus]|uniref:STAS domain-containing protein n=1 Tax=Maribellus maritimus TaxID=2870838 RepID=UPI001EEAA7F3|nr:STAS domain-containing protein [Maribellus maritimus]MCG6189049.1 STAS domain-containing protein [Maribellus maritimus]